MKEFALCNVAQNCCKRRQGGIKFWSCTFEINGSVVLECVQLRKSTLVESLEKNFDVSLCLMWMWMLLKFWLKFCKRRLHIRYFSDQQNVFAKIEIALEVKMLWVCGLGSPSAMGDLGHIKRIFLPIEACRTAIHLRNKLLIAFVPIPSTIIGSS